MATIRRLVGGLLFLGAYICLFIGLWGELVHYEESIQLHESWFQGTTDQETFDAVIDFMKVIGDPPIPVVLPVTRSLLGETNSQWSMLHILLDKAQKGKCSWLAPGVLFCFGVVIPALKFLGVLYWVIGGKGDSVVFHACGRLSRWTAVDAVAEAMIVALLLKGEVDAEHRLGYCTFISYCFLSAIAMWIMNDKGEARTHGLLPQFTARLCCGKGFPSCTPIVTILPFLAALVLGVYLYPMASIAVPRQAIEYNILQLTGEYQGPLMLVTTPEEVTAVVTEITNAIPLPSGNATVIEAAILLASSGHPYTVTGSVVLFIAVLLFPVLEAFFGCLVAIRASCLQTSMQQDVDKLLAADSESDFEGYGSSTHWTQLIWDATSDLSMLDVYVVGMWTAVMVLSTLGEFLVAELLDGFMLLLPATLFGFLHQAVCGHQLLTSQMAIDKQRADFKAVSKINVESSEENGTPSKAASRPFWACCGSKHSAQGRTISNVPAQQNQ